MDVKITDTNTLTVDRITLGKTVLLVVESEVAKDVVIDLINSTVDAAIDNHTWNEGFGKEVFEALEKAHYKIVKVMKKQNAECK